MKNLIFAALCCIAMSVNAASYFSAGDIGDVTLLIDYTLGRDIYLDEFQLAAADVNGDGRVDIDDVTAIIDKNLGK